MPDYLLTDPNGERFKLTVPAEEPSETAGTFGELKPRDTTFRDVARDWLLGDKPSPQRLQIVDQLTGKGLIKEQPDKPTLDDFNLGPLLNVKPEEVIGTTELGVVGGPRGFTSPRQIRSHLDEMREALRAGRITQEQYGQAREQLGLPREEPSYARPRPAIASRSANERTLGELRALSEPQMVSQALRPTSPWRSVRPAQDPVRPLGQDAGVQAFYENHIAKHFPDQREFVQSFFNGAYNGRFDVGTTWDNKLSIKGPLVIEGKKFGDIERVIGGDIAHHDYLRVDDATRGGGFVKQMTANQIDLYRKMGIAQVDLYANVDVGGYAWAKYGWLPTPQKWRDFSWSLGTRYRLLAPHLDADTRAVVEAFLNNPDPHAIWGLSDIPTPWQHPDWGRKIDTVGKAMLTGNNWDGSLLLNDPRQMTRFNDYVSQRK